MARTLARVVIASLLIASCAAPGPAPAAAVARALELDARAGDVRNHASQSGSMGDAVRAYVAALDAIDLSGAPADFADALRAHRDAWAATLPWMDTICDERGEMHAVLERVRANDPARAATLEPLMDRVWATWSRVEAAAARAGRLTR
jgi:hypothetical protein